MFWTIVAEKRGGDIVFKQIAPISRSKLSWLFLVSITSVLGN